MANSHEDKVRIHIDQKAYHAPSPITGLALYELAEVPESKALYREVEGNNEDKVIKIDDPKVELKQDEHLHTGKLPDKYYVVTVNTLPKVLDHDVVTHHELVKIAFPTPPAGTDPVFTVSYEHAKSTPHLGDLPPHGEITIRKHETIVDVIHTNRS